VDRPKADEGNTYLELAMRTAWGTTGSSISGADFDDTFVAPSTSSSDRFKFTVEALLAEPDGSGGPFGFHNSPYLYHLRWHKKGGVPENLARTVHDRQLAKAVTEHGKVIPGMLGLREGFLPVDLPFTMTEYYTPGEPWYDFFIELPSPDGDPASFQAAATARVYERGERVRQRWNIGPFGPAFPVFDFEPAFYAGRLGDGVEVRLPLFSDQVATHDGFAVGVTGTTELLRDGRPVGSSDSPGFGEFTVPADRGTYTLRTTATRDAPLSTSVSGRWTFESSHVDGEEPEVLPLLAVRFAPELDTANSAPRGRFEFPVYVQRNGSAKPGRVSTPSVEVSYDDGKTWAPAEVSRHRGQWTVTLDHPEDAAFVSLRASTSDAHGSSVEQTVVRAYALR
jgi:hypothetical protein